ncbi:MAG: hypothetical protein M3Q51_08855 [Pseudomonadota bacterium]|nr:hypothetical protein [Pseudomonadota bacterium]
MQTSTGNCLAVALAAAMLAACAPAPTPSSAPADASAVAVSGWYTQQGDSAQLRPCGDATALQVENGEALAARARDFGLQDGDPIYVKIHGVRNGAKLRLERVNQFGSPTPILDCPMGGTMIQH